MKFKAKNGVLVTIGFLLSPLSWWNDIFINVPIAYVIALPFSLISKTLFLPTFILGYWITNIIGFVLIQRGVTESFEIDNNKNIKTTFLKYLFASIIYTGVMIVLVKQGLIRVPF